MHQIFISAENRFVYSIHPDVDEIETVYKIVTAKTVQEAEKYTAKKFYKLSFWERLKFFGIVLQPKHEQKYNIIQLKNGKYDIQKKRTRKTYKMHFGKIEIHIIL